MQTSYSEIRQGCGLFGADAEAPVLGVVRGLVRDPAWMLRQGVEMRLQLGQRDPLSNRHAVAHDMQVRALKVDDPIAALILDPRIANVPFARHRPIEHRCSGRHLVDRQRQTLLDSVERLPDAVSRNAATDRDRARRRGYTTRSRCSWLSSDRRPTAACSRGTDLGPVDDKIRVAPISL